MAFGCHSRGGPRGNIYIYRNIADMRAGVNARAYALNSTQIIRRLLILSRTMRTIFPERNSFREDLLMSKATVSFGHYFAALQDPRINRRKLHLLLDIVAIAVCAVIAVARKNF